MKIQLGPKISDIFVAIYLTATLAFRFYLEPQFNGFIVVSLLFGGFMLLFLWALVKTKFLNPNWFGLLDRYKK